MLIPRRALRTPLRDERISPWARGLACAYGLAHRVCSAAARGAQATIACNLERRGTRSRLRRAPAIVPLSVAAGTPRSNDIFRHMCCPALSGILFGHGHPSIPGYSNWRSPLFVRCAPRRERRAGHTTSAPVRFKIKLPDIKIGRASCRERV